MNLFTQSTLRFNTFKLPATIGLSLCILTSAPLGQSVWVQRDGPPLLSSYSSQIMKSVTFGDDRFVAVGGLYNGSADTVYISKNSEEWSKTPGLNMRANSVACGKGSIVIVGDSGKIITSTDGKNYTDRTSGTTANLNFVIFADSRFVAAGTAGTILTSTDGIEWEAGISGTAANLKCITYGDSQFVAVGSGSLLTSTDGVQWVNKSVENNMDINSIAIGNGIFVAAAFDAMYTSSDGIVWKQTLPPTCHSLKFVLYAAGTFMVVGEWGQLYTSTDGITWMNNSSPGEIYCWYYSAAYGNGVYVVVGYGRIILSSPDANSWTCRSWTNFHTLNTVTFGNGKFLAAGGKGTIISSSDAIAWKMNESGSDAELFSATFGKDRYIVAGQGGTILTSPDCTTWTQVKSGTKNALLGVNFCNDLFIATGDSGTILTSPNGDTWTSRITGTARRLNDAAYGSGIFCVVGKSDSILLSSDGSTWTSRSMGLFSASEQNVLSIYSIIYQGNRFVAAGNPLNSNYNDVFISTDGNNWVGSNVMTLSRIYSVSYGNKQFVAVGSNHCGSGCDRTIISSSSDAYTWKTFPYDWSPDWGLGGLGPNADFFSVAFGDSQFVAVGDAGMICSSKADSTGDTKIALVPPKPETCKIGIVNNSLTIALPNRPSDEKVTVALYMLSGKKIFTDNFQLQCGIINVSLSGLPAGVVLATVSDKHQRSLYRGSILHR
jgi:hypothetical protein